MYGAQAAFILIALSIGLNSQCIINVSHLSYTRLFKSGLALACPLESIQTRWFRQNNLFTAFQIAECELAVQMS